MVQRNYLNRKQKRIIELLDRGYSIPTVARTLGMSRSGTYSLVANLCRRGYLIKHSETHSPVLYTSPIKDNNRTDSYHYPDEKKSDSVPTDYKNSTIPPTVCRDGIFFTNPPEKSFRWHMRDGIHFKVRAVGNYDDIIFCGRKIGEWNSVRDFNSEPDKKSRKREIVYHKGYIKAFGQKMNILYYKGKNCGDQFTLFPGSIFTIPDRYNFTDMVTIFSDRALWVADILRKNDWQITDPKFEEKNIHWATRDPELLALYDTNGGIVEDAELITDTSDTLDEVEAENLGVDPLRDEKVKVMAKLPERILAVEADIEEMSNLPSRILAVEADIEKMSDLPSRIQTIETNIEKMATVMVKFSNVIEKMETLQEKNTNILASTVVGISRIIEVFTLQEKATTIQAKISENIIASIVAGNQKTIDNFEKKQEEEVKPQNDDYKEAYR